MPSTCGTSSAIRKVAAPCAAPVPDSPRRTSGDGCASCSAGPALAVCSRAMDEPHARACLARVPGLTVTELRALRAAADGDLPRTLQRRTWQRVALADGVRAAL